MNEQIKDLADEAAKYSAVMALPTGQSGNELFVEKFAELIVGECAEVALKTDISYIEIDAMHGIRDRIKDHFGVI